MLLRLPAVGVVILLCASAGGAAGQGLSHATVTGTVRDASGQVVVGAAVTVSSDALIGGGRVTRTDDVGMYRVTALAPGRYVVEATASGFRVTRREGVLLPPGGGAVVDLGLDLAGLSDQVVVEATAAGVDVRSAAAPVRIDQTLLFSLPIPHDISRLINLVPGVSGDVAYGGSQRSNAIAVDGVNVTDPMFQDPQLRVQRNWVEQVHVAVLGAPAEYGGTTGVVANNVLRSGGNRRSGLAELWTIQPGWLGNNTRELSETLQTNFAPRRVDTWYEANAHTGGAIVQDRLWYFSGLQGGRREDRPAGYAGEGSRDERDWQWIGKLTASPMPALRLEGFMQWGQREATGEYLGRFTPLEATNRVVNDQAVWNLRGDWTLTNRTLLEVRHSGYDHSSVEDPMPPRTRQSPSPVYDLTSGIVSGTAYSFMDQQTNRAETTATVSHYLGNALGRHDLRGGVEFDLTGATQTYGYPGGRADYLLDGRPYGVELWAGDRGTATTRRLSLFAQDAWAPVSRLTISAGVRVDVNRGDVPRARGVFSTTPVSPRIGLAWDVRRDHRTVARLHYGRYHDTIFSSRIAQADPSGFGIYTFSMYQGDQLVEVSRSAAPTPYRIDPDMQHSGVDQWVVGVDHEVGAGIVLTAQGISRRFTSFMGLIDEGSAYTPVERRDPGPDGVADTADDGAILTVYARTNPGQQALVYTNPRDAWNRYDAAQVIGRRAFRGWSQFQASYTWSRNEGTVGNRWHVNAARFDLGSPGRFVNPNSFINANGRATHDPTHEWKVLGLARLPWFGGAMVSGIYRYTTGQAWGRRARITGLPQGFEQVRMEPQGARRLDALSTLDMRAEKTLPLGGARRTLGIYLEAFNLTNQGVADSNVPQAVVEISGPQFAQPVSWVSPRHLRAAVRYSF